MLIGIIKPVHPLTESLSLTRLVLLRQLPSQLKQSDPLSTAWEMGNDGILLDLPAKLILTEEKMRDLISMLKGQGVLSADSRFVPRDRKSDG